MPDYSMYWGTIMVVVFIITIIVIGNVIFSSVYASLKDSIDESSDTTTVIQSQVFVDGVSGSKISGVITTFSSAGNNYILTFKDDMSDYRFTGVDTTELYFIQYAFDNTESVSITYTMIGDERNVEGVTLSSPAPVPVDTPSQIVSNPEPGFNWWMLAPIFIVTFFMGGYALYNSVRSRRNIEAFTDRLNASQTENEPVTIRVEGEKVVRKKKKEQTEEENILPLDGRYRIDRADELLDEKNKNRKLRKKNKEK